MSKNNQERSMPRIDIFDNNFFFSTFYIRATFEDIGDSASPLEQPYINHGPEKGVAMGFFDDFFAFHHLYDGNSNIHNGKNFQE